jgi:FixJ family two-component response regulator
MGDSLNLYVAVVDDDESLCRSLARLLRASGMQAVTFLSAEAFLGDSKRCQEHRRSLSDAGEHAERK